MMLAKMNHSLKQRVIALVASLAILIATIMPAISQAMMSGQMPSGMIKVCSSAGTKFIPLSFTLIRNPSRQQLESLAVESKLVNNHQAKAMFSCGYCDKHTGTHTILKHFEYNLSPFDISNDHTASLSNVNTTRSHHPRGHLKASVIASNITI